MELFNVLFALSWIGSMALTFFIGITIGSAAVMKRNQETIKEFFGGVQGLFKREKNNNEQK